MITQQQQLEQRIADVTTLQQESLIYTGNAPVSEREDILEELRVTNADYDYYENWLNRLKNYHNKRYLPDRGVDPKEMRHGRPNLPDF